MVLIQLYHFIKNIISKEQTSKDKRLCNITEALFSTAVIDNCLKVLTKIKMD